MKFGQWLGIIILVVSLYILWEVRLLLLLVFTAVVFATALNRLARRLQRIGMPHNLAVLIAISLTLLLLTLFGLLIVPPFINQLEELIQLVPMVWESAGEAITDLERQLPNWLPNPPSIADFVNGIQPIGTEVIAIFFGIFSDSLTLLLQILLVLVLTIMMLSTPQSYRRGLLKLFPRFYRRRADAILSETEVALANWLKGILINCVFIGTLSGVGLAILGVPLVLAHALLAGVLNFIPNIGPTISVIFPIMVALVETPWKIIPILILYVIIQQIESYWLTPTVMAQQVSLLPAVTLAAQIFFATIFGLIGLLLALPLTVVAKTWIKEMLFKDILDRWHQEEHRALAQPVREAK